MYRLGFWQYVTFVWIMEYGFGIVVFSTAVDYFHYGTIAAADLGRDLFVWLLTGLFMGVSSYEAPAEG